MRFPWLDFAQVRAAERCKAASNVALVISHRGSKRKPNFEQLTSAYHLAYLRLVLHLELHLVACRNCADLSKLHGFEERRFLRVRGNLRAEVVPRIPGPAPALAGYVCEQACTADTAGHVAGVPLHPLQPYSRFVSVRCLPIAQTDIELRTP